jgi:hypothetical protein
LQKSRYFPKDQDINTNWLSKYRPRMKDLRRPAFALQQSQRRARAFPNSKEWRPTAAHWRWLRCKVCCDARLAAQPVLPVS